VGEARLKGATVEVMIVDAYQQTSVCESQDGDGIVAQV